MIPAGAADQPVVAVAAVERVVAAATAQPIVAGEAVYAIGLPVTGQPVREQAAGQVLDPLQHVVAGAAGVLAPRQRQVDVDGPAVVVVRGVVAAAAVEPVVARAAVEHVAAVAAAEVVRAGAAVQPVVAAAADQNVVTRAAGEPVPASAAENVVVAVSALAGVVAVAELQDIGACAAVHRIVAVPGGDAVVPVVRENLQIVVRTGEVEVIVAGRSAPGSVDHQIVEGDCPVRNAAERVNLVVRDQRGVEHTVVQRGQNLSQREGEGDVALVRLAHELVEAGRLRRARTYADQRARKIMRRTDSGICRDQKHEPRHALPPHPTTEVGYHETLTAYPARSGGPKMLN